MTFISKQFFYPCIQTDSTKNIGHTESFLSMTFHKVDLWKRKMPKYRMHYSCAPSLSFDVNLVCGCGQNKTLKNVVLITKSKDTKTGRFIISSKEKLTLYHLKMLI